MESMNGFRGIISAITGLIGGLVTMAFGGWSEGLATLVIFMCCDYVLGLAVAALFKNSPKTENGGLESRAGWKGLCRKAVTLVIVMMAYRIDLILDTNYIENAVIIGFICNEAISIIENAGLMGLPLPKAVTKAIDLLSAKADEEKSESEDESE
jgi:toxin secretion/phage lysis holin